MNNAILVVLTAVFVANVLVIVITLYMQIVHGLPPPWGARPDTPFPGDYPGDSKAVRDE